MGSFKVIAFRSLEPSDCDILTGRYNRPVSVSDTDAYNQEKEEVLKQQKITFGRGWYIFDDHYGIDDNDKPYKKTDLNYEIDTFVNINCIVGKNGSGKSTILEMIIRLMNNYICASMGNEYIQEKDKYLRFAENVFCELVIEVNNVLKIISCKNKCFSIKNINDPSQTLSTIVETNMMVGWTIQNEMENFLGVQCDIYSLLYTYSLYSFSDYSDIIPETDPNIEKKNVIFHNDYDSTSEAIDFASKYYIFQNGDNYNIPIGIFPKRIYNKYIDINKNNDESIKKLTDLLFYYDSFDLNGNAIFPFRNINKSIIINGWYCGIHIAYSSLDCKQILKYWCDKYELPIPENIKNDRIEDAWGYIVSESLIILDKETKYLYNFNSKSKNYQKKLSIEIVSQIMERNYNLTNNIRKTLVLLKFIDLGFVKINSLFNSKHSNKTYLLDNINISLDENKRVLLNYFGKKLYINDDKNILNENGDSFFSNETQISLEDISPSPAFFFGLDIEENGIIRSFSQLSSGEKQLFFFKVNFLYELLQIDRKGSYKYVNVLFDEVELYLHPEWQRKFLSNLLDGVKMIKFNNIKGVNITIATHSPFIISDLPKSNVLFLNDDGTLADKSIIGETFGANIHDLLKNGFFMDSTIGELARREIQQIVDFYKEFKDNGKNDATFEEKKRNLRNHFIYISSIIGDKYLKSTVEFMINEIYGRDNEIDNVNKVWASLSDKEKIELIKMRNK